MKMSLYWVTKAFEEWQDKVLEAEGEVSPELLEEFYTLSEDADAQLLNGGKVALNIGRNIKALADIIARYKAKKDALEARQKNIEDALTRVMSATGRKSYKTPEISLTFRPSQSVAILDEQALPEEYIRIKIERAPDKTKIKETIKAGGVVPGAELLSNDNLQIKE